MRVAEELPKGCEWIDLPVLGDHRGSLVAIEQSQTIPFDIARVYYLFGTKPGVTRGLHAHRTLTQLAVGLSGSCQMTLDNGRSRVSLQIDDPSKGLLLRPIVWREMSDFTPDCVLLVLADGPFVEGDYLRDYEAFRAASGDAR